MEMNTAVCYDLTVSTFFAERAFSSNSLGK